MAEFPYFLRLSNILLYVCSWKDGDRMGAYGGVRKLAFAYILFKVSMWQAPRAIKEAMIW